MLNFFKVVSFSVLLVIAFWGYSSYGIPKINPAPPPEDVELDLSSMTMDQFIALGDEIFQGKGTCTLCHNELGRAPMLGDVAVKAAERIKDPRYKGKATNAQDFIYESLVDPSAFVVAGFGKAGTNDEVSPMPDVSTGSVGLSEAELLAVVAYLQDTAGVDVTVEIPEMTAPSEDEGGAAPVALAKTGEEVAEKFGCGMCHKIAGGEGDMGPDLRKIGATRSADYLRRAILDPDADIAAGFDGGMMSPDFGDQMAASELELLVNYMASQK